MFKSKSIFSFIFFCFFCECNFINCGFVKKKNRVLDREQFHWFKNGHQWKLVSDSTGLGNHEQSE